jgi:hypothetical protein
VSLDKLFLSKGVANKLPAALPGIGQIVGGVMLAKNVLDLLGGLFGGGEPEPTWRDTLGPSPIHRNITPELQAMADRHRQARMMR